MRWKKKSASLLYSNLFMQISLTTTSTTVSTFNCKASQPPNYQIETLVCNGRARNNVPCQHVHSRVRFHSLSLSLSSRVCVCVCMCGCASIGLQIDSQTRSGFRAIWIQISEGKWNKLLNNKGEEKWIIVYLKM